MFLPERNATRLTVVFLLLLPPLFFWRETLGLFTLGQADIVSFFFPAQAFAFEQIRSGSLPLWNPHQYGGVPLFGHWQWGLLDPLNWVYLFGATSRMMTLSQELSFALALLSTFGFARGLGLKRRAGVAAAVIYSLGGFAVARSIYPAYLHVTALTPLVLLCIERLHKHGRWRDAAIGSLVIAWQLFAGHPQPFVYSSMLAAGYVIFRVSNPTVREGFPAPKPSLTVGLLTRSVAMFAMGAMLAAVQLLPAWEVAAQSVRNQSSYEFFTSQSFHPLSLLNTIVPFLHGQGKSIYQLNYWGSYWTHNEAQFYLGVAALALAGACAAGLWRESSRQVKFWSLVAIVGLLMAMGGYIPPLARLLYQAPLLGGFRGANRHWMEVSLAVAMLGGFAIDRLLRPDAREEARVVARLAGIIAVSLSALCAAVGAIALWRTDWAERFLRRLPDLGHLPPGFLDRAGAEFYVPILTAMLLTLAIFLFVRARNRARWFPLLLAVMIVDFHFYALFAPINNRPALESLLGQAVPAELAGMQEAFRSHLLLKSDESEFSPFWFANHESATGYDPLLSRRYKTFSGVNEAGRSERWLMLGNGDRTLDLMNVRYLLVPSGYAALLPKEDFEARWREVPLRAPIPHYGGLRVYQNLRALPRAWLAQRVEFQSEEEQLRAIRGETPFDPMSTALLDRPDENKFDLRRFSQAAAGTPRKETTILSRTPNAMTISADSDRPSILVMSEVAYPGWQARIDGREAELLRVDYLLRGVGLPAGRHTVEVFYRPQSLIVGAIVSLLALPLLLLAAFGGFRLRLTAPRRLRLEPRVG